MKYEGKATRFAELSKLTTLTSAEKKERQELHDELHARGFNPKNPDGIVERAIIFDHRTTVKRYCELHERVSHADKCTQTKSNELARLENTLKAYGIQNLDRHYLKRCLASFKIQKKRADKRKKANRGVSVARQQADQDMYKPITSDDITDDVFNAVKAVYDAAKASARKAAEDAVNEILESATASGAPIEISQEEIDKEINDAINIFF